MSRTVVMIVQLGEDRNQTPYREAIANDATLRDRVELRFTRSETLPDVIGEAEVLVCAHVSEEALARAERLRWITFWSAGLDGKITERIQARNLLITNASGVHGPNIAEHVMAWMLMFMRRMDVHFRAQIEGVWRRNDNTQRMGVEELTDQTLGIVGMGRIGEALTVRAQSFGMRVIGLKRNPQARYDAAVQPDAIYGMEDLPRLLGESDHVCIALPYTPETHHLFDAETFASMKPSAYFYNIARGKIVDEAALIAALQEGRLAGAGLDVFEQEPLPAESPLWKLPNVLLTPHTSGLSPHYFARAAALFTENLRRYVNGEPLHNLYDPTRGY